MATNVYEKERVWYSNLSSSFCTRIDNRNRTDERRCVWPTVIIELYRSIHAICVISFYHVSLLVQYWVSSTWFSIVGVYVKTIYYCAHVHALLTTTKTGVYPIHYIVFHNYMGSIMHCNISYRFQNGFSRKPHW